MRGPAVTDDDDRVTEGTDVEVNAEDEDDDDDADAEELEKEEEEETAPPPKTFFSSPLDARNRGR